MKWTWNVVVLKTWMTHCLIKMKCKTNTIRICILSNIHLEQQTILCECACVGNTIIKWPPNWHNPLKGMNNAIYKIKCSVRYNAPERPLFTTHFVQCFFYLNAMQKKSNKKTVEGILIIINVLCSLFSDFKPETMACLQATLLQQSKIDLCFYHLLFSFAWTTVWLDAKSVKMPILPIARNWSMCACVGNRCRLCVSAMWFPSKWLCISVVFSLLLSSLLPFLVSICCSYSFNNMSMYW